MLGASRDKLDASLSFLVLGRIDFTRDDYTSNTEHTLFLPLVRSVAEVSTKSSDAGWKQVVRI